VICENTGMSTVSTGPMTNPEESFGDK